ncbi:MAG: ATP-binding cassette domain-containing protein [Thermomicrobiales bacterium]
MQQSPPWAVETHGLVKTFGSKRAVDGIDLTVPAGTIYGVLGPNGAGKSTTLRILSTLLRPDGGAASVFGHDVVREAQTVRQLIGVTGQDASVDEALSAEENLYLFGRLHGLSRAAARQRGRDLLAEFGLSDAAKRQVTHFSGGMRRRLDLAASLISRPPLIFLDEPTTGLDPRTRTQMWDTIRALVAAGSTVLLTTQYLDEADQLADRIGVIDQGRLVAEGTPDELKDAIGARTLQITVADPSQQIRARATISSLLGVEAALQPELGELTAPLADTSLVTDLLVALRNQGVEIGSLAVQKPTLDEVFLTLTGRAPAEEAADEEIAA